MRIFKEFDDERRDPLRVADKQDRSACPGQRHVEKTAFLGVRESRTASCLKKHRRLPRSGCGSLRGGYLSALRYAEFGQY